MPPFDQIQKQLKEFTSGLSVKQGLLLAGAVLLTIAILVGFVNLIATPDYKPLVSGMEPSDAQALSAKLAAKNIPYQLSADGKTVNVPSDKLDASRMEVASDGMPRSGRLGFELFDKLNWGQTEFDEKVNYQRALEGELERSIQTLRDVDSARVHLVLPTDSVFIDRERAAKASVVLKLRSGRLPEETQLGIARLVAGAVDNLSPENVTVIDADTNRPLGMARRDSIAGDGSLEQALTARLMQTLAPVVGPQHVRASVNVEYDPSTSEENEETYDPKSAVAVSSQSSEERVGGAITGGVPGTSSNVPSANNLTETGKAATANPKTPAAGATPASANAAPPGNAQPANAQSGNAQPANAMSRTLVAEGGDETQISKSESNTYAVNKLVRHTLEPPGRLRRISAALLVDDAVDVKQENGKSIETRRKRTPDELKQITDLATAAIGIDTDRGDTLTVQNLSFEQTNPETLPKPTALERVRVTLNDWSSFVRYAALILLFLLAYALLLRPMKKQILTTLRELPARRVPEQTQIDGVVGAQLSPAQDPKALPPEQQRSLTLKKQLLEKVKAEAVATSQLVQAWIHEEAK
ncbi:MAG: flagellar basal-body MS-ring/collar protein FliF [Terriglobales bacterium]